MAFIPEDKIADIRNAADIVEVVSESVLLKKAGKDYVGLCPFHSEKTPSFTVSPEKQIFYCFGCGAGGNVFTFLIEQERLSFPEAVKTLARRYGIDLPEPNMSPEQQELMRERESLFTINQQAADFFHHTLVESDQGKEARAYLDGRGITKETIEVFRIGYVPDEWDSLVTFFSEKQIPLHLVEKAGLIIPRKTGDSFYDRFRNRIIFPITDIRNQVIAFGGRVMDDSLPKYLNTPETQLFSKSRTLYGLPQAKQKGRQENRLFMVEGYVDVLSLYQSGIQNTVATLGTSLTRDHVRMLKGYAGKIILVYDSDEAGVRAARRSIEIFRKENTDARILTLPSGHDPDSYVLEFGPEAFIKVSENALSAMTFLADIAIKTHGLSVEGRLRIISDMAEPLAVLDDPVARSLYIRELAERIQVKETEVLEKVRNASRNKSGGRNPKSENQNTSPREQGARIERQIIAMMLQFPEILPEIEGRDILGKFESELLRAVGHDILERHPSERPVAQMVSPNHNKTKADIITSLAMKNENWDYEGCLRLIDQFEAGQKRRNQSELLQKIKTAKEGDDALLLELQNQVREVKKSRI